MAKPLVQKASTICSSYLLSSPSPSVVSVSLAAVNNAHTYTSMSIERRLLDLASCNASVDAAVASSASPKSAAAVVSASPKGAAAVESASPKSAAAAASAASKDNRKQENLYEEIRQRTLKRQSQSK